VRIERVLHVASRLNLPGVSAFFESIATTLASRSRDLPGMLVASHRVSQIAAARLRHNSPTAGDAS
jgi:hypothetical protein